MSKKIRRIAGAALAVTAAFAMVAPSAFAAPDTAPQIDIDGSPLVAVDGPVVGRIAADDRIATAIKAACSLNKWRLNGEGRDDLILVASDNDKYADALASAPLADYIDAPILVTPAGDKLDQRIVNLLVVGCDGKRNTADDYPFDRVTITSGTGVLTDKIVKQLESKPVTWNTAGTLPADGSNVGLGANTVSRWAGSNRYETSSAIAWNLSQKMHWDGKDNVDVFFADGLNFPDALAAGAAAAEHDGVVLLTMGGTGLDQSTFDFASNAPRAGFHTLNHRQIWAVGGNANAAVDMGRLGVPVEPSNRIKGIDRYQTATLLAKAVWETAPVDFVVTSGENPADALFAGGFAANIDGPLLLTPAASLSPFTATYLKDTASSGSRVIVFGGTGSVTPTVQGQIVTAVTKI